MRPKRAILIASLLVLTCLGLLGILAHKTVTLVVDGQSRSLMTYVLTVEQLLRIKQVPTSPQDRLVPNANQWLRDGETVSLDHAVQVQVLADGIIHTLLSAERAPERLLAQAGISLRPGDKVLRNGLPVNPDESLPRASSYSLQIRRAVTITLTTIGEELGKSSSGPLISNPALVASVTRTITSTAATLGEALWDAGITLYAADRLAPPPGTPLTSNLHATLKRSRPFIIQAQDGNLPIRSSADTVGQALAEVSLSLQGLDYSLPAADAPLPTDGHIRLVRVHEEVIIEQTPIPFKTETKTVSNVELDDQKIVQPGLNGINARRVRVRYEDGQEVSRQVEAEYTALLPQPRIIGYGTMIVKHSLDTPNGTIQYWRALQFYATSYHPSETGSDVTASGMKLQKGVVGIDPRYIPYGTRMYIPGYGFAEAADRGCTYGRWIDLGYSDSDYVPWHEWITVYFLWPPPDFVPETIPPPITCTGYAP